MYCLLVPNMTPCLKIQVIPGTFSACGGIASRNHDVFVALLLGLVTGSCLPQVIRLKHAVILRWRPQLRTWGNRVVVFPLFCEMYIIS